MVNPSLDPCQSDAPIFKCTGLSDSACISHVTLELGQGNAYGVNMIDHVWVFKFMYLAVSGNNPHYILKVYGNPRLGTLTYKNYITSYSSSVQILSLVSLEMFGFYVTLDDGNRRVFQYQLDMTVDPGSATGALLVNSDGDYAEIEANRAMVEKFFTPDTSFEQRLF